MDVHIAFLQRDLNEEIFMEMPPGFGKKGEKMVCKLQKSLYGLKQASEQWNLKLTETLKANGYVQSKANYSMLTKFKGENVVILLIYVDDILITRSNEEMVSRGSAEQFQN